MLSIVIGEEEQQSEPRFFSLFMFEERRCGKGDTGWLTCEELMQTHTATSRCRRIELSDRYWIPYNNSL